MSDAAWGLLENIVTVVCASLLAYFVSPWCLFLLLNINYRIRVMALDTALGSSGADGAAPARTDLEWLRLPEVLGKFADYAENPTDANALRIMRACAERGSTAFRHLLDRENETMGTRRPGRETATGMAAAENGCVHCGRHRVCLNLDAIAALETALGVQPTRPDAYTVAAEVDGQAVRLTQFYLGATPEDVLSQVLVAARREGFQGTAQERMAALEWSVAPLYASGVDSTERKIDG